MVGVVEWVRVAARGVGVAQAARRWLGVGGSGEQVSGCGSSAVRLRACAALRNEEDLPPPWPPPDASAAFTEEGRGEGLSTARTTGFRPAQSSCGVAAAHGCLRRWRRLGLYRAGEPRQLASSGGLLPRLPMRPPSRVAPTSPSPCASLLLSEERFWARAGGSRWGGGLWACCRCDVWTPRCMWKRVVGRRCTLRNTSDRARPCRWRSIAVGQRLTCGSQEVARRGPCSSRLRPLAEQRILVAPTECPGSSV